MGEGQLRVQSLVMIHNRPRTQRYGAASDEHLLVYDDKGKDRHNSCTLAGE